MERFDEHGKVDEKGKFDKEGKDLNFDAEGKLIEPDPDATLENLHAAAEKGKNIENQFMPAHGIQATRKNYRK